MYPYLPFFVKLTTSFAVLPGWISGVFLPWMLKSCNTWPMFLKTNVTFPGLATDFVESLKKNSPPLTWTVVPVAAVFTVAAGLAVFAVAGGLAATVFVGTADDDPSE